LYISCFFPPLGGAESRHNLGLIRKFYEKGFLPTILTASENYPYPRDHYLEKLVPEKIKVKRISSFHTINKYIYKARELIKIPQNPLIFEGWRDLYKISRVELESRKYRFVYSVHGIGAAHLAALKLKMKEGLPWVAEFRDPWFHNSIVRKYIKDKSMRWWYKYQWRKTEMLSKEVLRNADLIVVESPMHGEFLVRDFNIRQDKVVSYGMGYDEDYFYENEKCLISFNQKPVIGFIGSIYYGYENTVKNFISALSILEQKGYKFTFVSVGDSSVLFSRYSQEIGFKSFIPIERVSLSKALSIMREMNFGVVYAIDEHKSNISSKLWDYLKSNLSILAVAPKDGAMAKIINDGNCGYIFPYDIRGMIETLEKAFIDYKRGKTFKASPDFISQFSRENMVNMLIQRIKKII